uniref:Muscle RAS onco homolog n=1 Tax=Astyanax mexicanus TaxID=7994 RepID=A0A3B1K8M4_ASTMX
NSILCLRTGQGFRKPVPDSTMLNMFVCVCVCVCVCGYRESFPMVLVANKVDLVHLRKITSEQGREMAMKHSITYIETSAKDPPMNVDKAFHELVRVIRQQIPERAQKKKKKTKWRADRPSGSARLHCVLL